MVTTENTGFIWANSGDAHVLEPSDLWEQRLPADLAARMPRAEKVDDRTEVIHVDGLSFERRMPASPVVTEVELEEAGLIARGRQAGARVAELSRPPGAFDVQIRLEDLDDEGIWGEVVYPSVTLWSGYIRDPALYREGARVANDWLKETFIDVTPRSIPAAEISTRSVDDAVAETTRAAGMGFKAINLPVGLDETVPNWNDESWEPLWATAEEAGMVLATHVGTGAEGKRKRNQMHSGPGGAVLNYVETGFGAQRLASTLIASGVLDRHPQLKLLVSEGGASWVPGIADRMTEAYRQHGFWVRPKLSRLPSEILYDQVYASFQHDQSAVQTYSATGYRNILWGSDYPHIEGTFGHTQKTLHELFDDIDKESRYRMTRGAFLELFPDVGEPPGVSEMAPSAPV